MQHRQLAARDPDRYMGKQFTPLVSFKSPEVNSSYVPGLLYTIDNSLLAGLALQWEADGRIQFLDLPSVAQVKGS